MAEPISFPNQEATALLQLVGAVATLTLVPQSDEVKAKLIDAQTIAISRLAQIVIEAQSAANQTGNSLLPETPSAAQTPTTSSAEVDFPVLSPDHPTGPPVDETPAPSASAAPAAPADTVQQDAAAPAPANPLDTSSQPAASSLTPTESTPSAETANTVLNPTASGEGA